MGSQEGRRQDGEAGWGDRTGRQDGEEDGETGRGGRTGWQDGSTLQADTMNNW